MRFGPTQKDIADALGVSQSTVAMALSPQYENRLLEETALRIKKYAEEIGYHPQRFAQIMQGGQTKVVGIVVRQGLYAISTALVNQLANEFTRLGYRIFVVDPTWFDSDTDEVKRYLLDQGAEGVIICNIVTQEADEIANKLPEKLPVIGLQSILEKAPSFYIDPHSAYYDITRLYIALGVKHLGLLLPLRDSGYVTPPGYTIIKRASGFAKAIEEAGGEVLTDRVAAEQLNQPSLLETATGKELVGEIIYAPRAPGTTSIQQHAYREVTRLIKAGTLPEAMICGNDDLAQGTLAALLDNGVSVPGEILLSGYDDTLSGQYSAVPITTIRPWIQETVTAAVKQLLLMIEDPDKCRRTHLERAFQNDIILRRSSGSDEALYTLKERGLPETVSRVLFDLPREAVSQQAPLHH